MKYTWILIAAMVVIAGIYGLTTFRQPGPDHAPVMAGDSSNQDGLYPGGPFRVSIHIDPETPVVGENKMTLRLLDTNAMPVTGASIHAVAEMAAMGSMPAMRASVELTDSGMGVYAGPFRIAMNGAWPLSLRISKPGLGETTLHFDMNTRRTGLRLLSGGGSQTDQDGQNSGTVYLDSRRRQAIGVETGEVVSGTFMHTVRAVGEVTYDESQLTDINLRFDAWIGDLYADSTGKVVRRGEALFTVYGPELLAAQQEYLEVLKRDQTGSRSLLTASRKRLALWGMGEEQIRQLEQRKTPLDYVPILSPVTGTVIEKHIVAGSAHKAGMTMMRIADLSVVWVEVEVYESDLPLISQGMAALVRIPYVEGKEYPARVDYIYPYLDGSTRAGRVRLVLDNPEGQLKPDMYAEVRLHVDLGQRLMVPEEAVLFAGDSRVVFQDMGNGELKPVRIRTGLHTRDHVEVLAGLSEGDRIVTSGTFLIAAESKLKSGIKQW